MQRTGTRLAAVGFGTLVALAVAEAGIRFGGLGLVSMSRGTFHTYDPEAGWTCLPDVDSKYEQPGSFNVAIRCNSRGLRDVEHPLEKPPGRRRIVCLGDSFMWGYGVEQSEMFSTALARELDDTLAVLDDAGGVRIENRPVRAQRSSPVEKWLNHNSRLYVEMQSVIKKRKERTKALANRGQFDGSRPGHEPESFPA